MPTLDSHSSIMIHRHVLIRKELPQDEPYLSLFVAVTSNETRSLRWIK